MSPAAQGPAARVLRVVHVEDSPLDAELVLERLASDGVRCDVRRVDDRAGLERALREGPVDVLLSDFSLPSFDGLAALETARALRPDVPFVFVSGAIGEERAIETLRSGATDYVLKHRLERLAPAVLRAVRECDERRERRRANERVERLQALASGLVSVLTPGEVARVAVELGGAAVRASCGSCWLVGEGGGDYEVGYLSERAPPEGHHAPCDGPEVPGRARLALAVDGRRLGLLCFAWEKTDEYALSEGDRSLLEAVAGLCAQALDRARLFRETQLANKLKDEFLATVSHELRTPLNAVLGWATLLRARDDNEGPVQRGLEVIERNARAQARLIEDVLDVSRIVTGKLHIERKPMELAAAVRAAVDVVMPAAAAKDVSLAADLDPQAGKVYGDAVRLQQVVWNLCTNAVKFTPRGGSVRVKTGRVGDRVFVRVSDSGKGIEPAFLPYVFDRFRQADSSSTRKHGGLGLGLAIAHHLVEQHGGALTAESEGLGRGATFIVSLPVFDPAEVPPDTRAVARADADQSGAYEVRSTLRGLRLLVCDDELDARELAAELLQSNGAEVLVASSAAEALAVLEESLPDVLVSDIGMAGTDGLSLVRAVRSLPDERGGRTPAVALTAYASAQDAERALAAGFQRHLAKPVDPRELVAVVAGLGRRSA